MFVKYFGVLERPYVEVSEELIDLREGMPGWADVAYRHGEEMVARLSGPGMVAKEVTLELGEPLRAADHTSLPLSWWATGTPTLFPTMEAELTIAAIGPDLTQVTFQGSYKPPLGAVGRVLDRALLHRFAEASVKDFVDRVIEQLDGSTTIGMPDGNGEASA